MGLNDEVSFTDGDAADLTRSCTRKRGYPTEAVAALAVSAIRGLDPNAQVRTYGCRRCGQWHVGGVPRAEQEPGQTVALDDSFDGVRDRRRHSPPRDRPARRGYGGPYSRRRVRRKDSRDDDD